MLTAAKCVISARLVWSGIGWGVVISARMLVAGLCVQQAHPGNYCRDLGVALVFYSSA